MEAETPSPGSDPLMRRWVCRVEDDYPFAYLRGDKCYRGFDHLLWAHLRDGMLISERTGALILVQSGNYFADPETGVHRYYLSDPR